MFKVNSGSTLRLLSWRSVKKSVIRNIVAVIAIILTTVMFTALFSVVGGFIDQMNQSENRMRGGTAMGSIKRLSEPEYMAVQRVSEGLRVGATRLVGTAEVEALKKFAVEVRYGDIEAADMLLSKPTAGGMPQRENEIALSTLILDSLGILHEIGAEIEFAIAIDEGGGSSHTYAGSFVLCGYWQGDKVMPAQQAWVSAALADKIAPAAQQAFAETNCYAGLYMLEIDFPNRLFLDKQMTALLQEAGLPDADYSVDGVQRSGEGLDFQTVFSAVLLLGTILLSGYLIIYNVFFISVVQDIQFYGLLKTIGASGRQIKKIVFWQAMFLSAIGVPAGLFLGWAVGRALLPRVLASFMSVESSNIYHVPPLMMVFAALFSLVTVLVSCVKPARTVGRISPVEAARYAGGKPHKSGKRKTHKDRATPFGMAKADIRRHSGKFVLVVLSLGLSLTLMNTTYTAVTGFDLDKFIAEQVVGDFWVTHYSIASPGFGDKDIHGITPEFEFELARLNGITNQHAIYATQGKQPMDVPQWEMLMTRYRAAVDGPAQYNMQLYEGNDSFDYFLYGMDDTTATKEVSLQRGEWDAALWETGDYVVVGDYLPVDGSRDYLNLYDVGDTITLYDTMGTPFSYTVMGVGSLRHDLTMQVMTSDTVYVYLPETQRQRLMGDSSPMTVYFDVDAAKRPAAEEWIADYCANVDDDLVYRSRATYAAEFEQDKLTFSMIGGVLSLILGVIGVMNYTGTMITSISARKRELAVLAAVGMSRRQVKQMLVWESLAYIVSALILTATFGVGLGWFAGENIFSVFWSFSWRFTLAPVFVCLPFLLALAVAVPLTYYKIISNESIVERLRTE